MGSKHMKIGVIALENSLAVVRKLNVEVTESPVIGRSTETEGRLVVSRAGTGGGMGAGCCWGFFWGVIK